VLRRIIADQHDKEHAPPRQSSDFMSIAQNIGLEDFKKVGQMPCARMAFLYGIGGGAGLGAIRFFSRRNISSASNWAFGAFCLTSAISWEVCRYKRRYEHERLQTVITQLESRRKQPLVVVENMNEGDLTGKK